VSCDLRALLSVHNRELSLLYRYMKPQGKLLLLLYSELIWLQWEIGFARCASNWV
jgi:hypothetical protein